MNLAQNTRPRRRPSLTPMIDVVFLLLVFFMLASRFGVDAVLPLPLAGGGGTYNGAPRLVDIAPSEVRLNGIPVTTQTLADRLISMMEAANDPIIIRPRDGATVQRVITVTDTLRQHGLSSLILVE